MADLTQKVISESSKILSEQGLPERRSDYILEDVWIIFWTQNIPNLQKELIGRRFFIKNIDSLCESQIFKKILLKFEYRDQYPFVNQKCLIYQLKLKFLNTNIKKKCLEEIKITKQIL